MRYYFLIITLVALSCTSNHQNKQQGKNVKKENTCFEYPIEVDSLQLRDLYDSTRWYVYTWHGDEAYLPVSDSTKSISFGELPLRFDFLRFRNDTLEILFHFIDRNKPILYNMTRNRRELVTGAGFDMKTRKRVYMLSPNGFGLFEKGPMTRYENPLQPEVVAYIKNNWNKLDPCYKELIRQKGIMK